MTLISRNSVLRGRALLFALLVAGAAVLSVGRAAPVMADGVTNGVFDFGSAAYSVGEGGTVHITINRTGGTAGTQTVEYSLVFNGTATAGDLNGFSPSPGFITFDPGVSSRTIDAGAPGSGISTFDDAVNEGNETVTFTIASVAGGGAIGSTNPVTTLTITDNDAPGITVSPTSGLVTTESGGQATFTVRLNTLPSADVTIGLSSSDATEGTVSPPSLTFTSANGTTPQTVTVTGVDDGVIDGNVAYTIITAAATSADVDYSGVNPADVSVTNNDNDNTGTIAFSSATYTTGEGVTATMSVTRSGGSSGAATVQCNTVASGTATAGVDYTPIAGQVLSWASGDTTTKNCQVAIASDFVVEGNETFGMSLTNVTGASLGLAAATVTIQDTIAPNITFLSPNFGPAAGGNTVIITGTGFLGVTTVTFGGTSASFAVNSANQITATAPAKPAGVVDVRVSNASGTSPDTTADDYTYTGGPTITLVNPSVGPITGGTTVTITGTGFTGAFAVKFGTTNATTFTFLSSTTISAVSPAHVAGTVDISVTTPAGTTANTSADDFTYGTGPAISAISPGTGPTAGGTVVSIIGANLLGVTSVNFGATPVASFTVNSSTSITAVSPPHAAGTVDVSVTSAAGTSGNTASDNFIYTGGPAITSISPTSGSSAGGTTVTVNGVGFTGATSVTVGGKTASFFVNSDSKITLTTPSGTAGTTVDIRVTTPAGTSANTSADNFSYSGGTHTYTLYFRWNLIVWMGQNGVNADTAVQGGSGQTNVSSIVTSILRWNAAQQKWETFFPGKASVPGANDFTTLENGRSYWLAVTGSSSWTINQP